MSEEKVELNEEKVSSAKPSWVRMKKEELEKIVIELAKEGKGPAAIGMILRDKHGVPKVKLLGRRISEILKEKGIEYKTEKKIFEARVESLKAHIGKNNKDYPASRALTKQLWVLKDLENEV